MKPLKLILCTSILCLFLAGCGGKGGVDGNPQIDSVTGPHVNFVNGRVLVTMVFHEIKLDLGLTVPIPKYPNSSFQIGPDFQTGGLLLMLGISVLDFLGNQGEGFDRQTLPGGRPLPGVTSGTLPAVAVRLPMLNDTVLYLGPTVIGLFVPFSGIQLAGIILSFRFFDTNDNPIGTLSLVGADLRGQNSGLLALMHPDLLGIRGEAARRATLREYYDKGYRY